MPTTIFDGDLFDGLTNIFDTGDIEVTPQIVTSRVGGRFETVKEQPRRRRNEMSWQQRERILQEDEEMMQIIAALVEAVDGILI